MTPYGGRNPLQSLVQVVLLVLLGAIALYWAVQLIKAVWVWLVVLASITALVWIASAVMRRRNRFW